MRPKIRISFPTSSGPRRTRTNCTDNKALHLTLMILATQRYEPLSRSQRRMKRPSGVVSDTPPTKSTATGLWLRP